MSSISSLESSSSDKMSFFVQRNSFLVCISDHHLVFRVFFRKSLFDVFFFAGRDIFPHKIGADRQFPVAPVNQDSKLDAFGTPKIDQRVKRTADRAARV